MKKNITLILLLCLPGFLNAQKAFRDCQFYASLDTTYIRAIIESEIVFDSIIRIQYNLAKKNQVSFTQPGKESETTRLTKNLAIYKERLLKGNLSAGNASQFKFFLKEEMGILNDLLSFLKNPFDFNVKTPVRSDIERITQKYESGKKAILSNKDLPITGFNNTISFNVNGLIDKVNPAFTALNGLTGSGFLNTDTLLRGLVLFISEEFKAAGTQTYLSVFNSTIEKVPELKHLLPDTYLFLKTLPSQNVQDLGLEIKASFETDLHNLADNLIKLIENTQTGIGLVFTDEIRKKIRDSNEYKYLKLVYDIKVMLDKNTHISDIIYDIDSKYYASADKAFQPIGKLFHGLSILSENLTQDDTLKKGNFSNIWYSFSDIRHLAPKEKYYFLVLLVRTDTTFFKEGIDKIKTITMATIDKIESTEVFVQLKTAFDIYTEINALIKKQDGEFTYTDALKLLQVFGEFIKNKYCDQPSTCTNTEQLQRFVVLANYGIKIYEAVKNKDLVNIGLYVRQIIEAIVPENVGPQAEENIQLVLNILQKYTSFMSAVAQAKTSQDVKNTIKTSIVGHTSYIQKRNHKFTASISVMPGYFVSWEKFDVPRHKSSTVTTGLTAPIGVDLSFTRLRNKLETGKLYRNLSAYIQVLDLGSMLNFTLKDSTSAFPEKIQIQDVFSPGFAISWGFRNSPCNISAGYQLTPKLRSITVDGNQYNPYAHRVFLRFSWDITLLYIGKSKKIKLPKKGAVVDY